MELLLSGLPGSCRGPGVVEEMVEWVAAVEEGEGPCLSLEEETL